MSDITTSSQDVELVDQSSGIRANVVSTASGGVQLIQQFTPLPTGNNWLGLVSIAQPINSLVSLGGSSNFIGLVTTYPGRGGVTTFAGYISASGYSTLLVPPADQKWYLNNAMINSKGVADGFIGSATVNRWPWTSLATSSGWAMPFGEPGISADLINQSLTIYQTSPVTLSYGLQIHFEAS